MKPTKPRGGGRRKVIEGWHIVASGIPTPDLVVREHVFTPDDSLIDMNIRLFGQKKPWPRTKWERVRVIIEVIKRKKGRPGA